MFDMNHAACLYSSAGVNSWTPENKNGLFIAPEAALLSWSHGWVQWDERWSTQQLPGEQHHVLQQAASQRDKHSFVLALGALGRGFSSPAFPEDGNLHKWGISWPSTPSNALPCLVLEEKSPSIPSEAGAVMAHDNCKAAIIVCLGIHLGNGLEKLRRPEIQDVSRLSFPVCLVLLGLTWPLKLGFARPRPRQE